MKLRVHNHRNNPGNQVPVRAKVIGLLTDFGLKDSYVAEMHAVLLSNCNNINIIDISHLISPGDTNSASCLLARSAKYFPGDSIIVAVVDPGVGTQRQAVVVSSGGKYYVAPDNGVLSRVIDWSTSFKVRVLSTDDSPAETIFPTFHGRDLFIPAAVRLANGESCETLGDEGVFKATFKPEGPRKSGRKIIGHALYIDRFGNIATDIPNAVSGRIHLARDVILTSAKTYGERQVGELFWVCGSDGHIEIAANGESAAGTLGIQPGDRVVLEESQ